MKEFLYFWVGFVTLQLVIIGLLGWVARLSGVLFEDELERDDENDE